MLPATSIHRPASRCICNRPPATKVCSPNASGGMPHARARGTGGREGGRERMRPGGGGGRARGKGDDAMQRPKAGQTGPECLSRGRGFSGARGASPAGVCARNDEREADPKFPMRGCWSRKFVWH